MTHNEKQEVHGMADSAFDPTDSSDGAAQPLTPEELEWQRSVQEAQAEMDRRMARLKPAHRPPATGTAPPPIPEAIPTAPQPLQAMPGVVDEAVLTPEEAEWQRTLQEAHAEMQRRSATQKSQTDLLHVAGKARLVWLLLAIVGVFILVMLMAAAKLTGKFG